MLTPVDGLAERDRPALLAPTREASLGGIARRVFRLAAGLQRAQPEKVTSVTPARITVWPEAGGPNRRNGLQ